MPWYQDTRFAQYEANAKGGCKRCEIVIYACNAAYSEHGLTEEWRMSASFESKSGISIIVSATAGIEGNPCDRYLSVHACSGERSVSKAALY
jgi:maleate cis-trans isomerase